MPDGRVKWFDPSSGRGVVEHSGREYAVSDADIDNQARVAGAPVHFDIQHSGAGDVAVNVTMREGTRTSQHTSRYGDQAGAHHPPDKGQDEGSDLNPRSKRRRAYADQPRVLVDDWIAHLASNQTDRAAALYAPDARIHEGDTTVTGGRDIRRHLTASPLAGADAGRVEVKGAGGDTRFAVAWPPMQGETAAVLTTLRIEHGQIAEQWITEAS